jgi:hypothetical protein
MALTDQWALLEAELAADWTTARVGIDLADQASADETLAALAPLQPLRSMTGSVSIRINRNGGGPGTDALRRGLARLDAKGIRARVAIVGVDVAPAPVAATPTPSLVGSWLAELATVPADWSDIVAEIELDSSDYLDPAAVYLAPINPRRIGPLTVLRFRSARRFGYGASAGMVGACLERCDDADIRGRVRILQALCDTQPVGTQGPVWRLDGQTV